MFIAFNIVLILLVALIAYWWANQGLFSALLHLLCVVLAGAIALAFWEPLTVGLLLDLKGFSGYAWGVSLVLLFAVTLFLLRLAFDRLAPANVAVPHWANLTFGGLFGAGAGVLTIGILVIGCGFIQSTNEFMGFKGYRRDLQTSRVEKINGLFLPFHEWTADFYGWLSVGSLESAQPLWHYYPDLDRQATLIRDSFGGGRGQISMPPEGCEVKAAYSVPESNRFLVKVHFNNESRDFGHQLTISSSQIRLIERVPRGSARKARTIYPDIWTGWEQGAYHQFDDTTYYITSEPGKKTSDALIEFQIPANFTPGYIQIRGTRYALPAQRAQIDQAQLQEMRSGRDLRTRPANVVSDWSSVPQIPRDDIRVKNDIRPVSVSTNMLPAGISHIDRYLSEGKAEFRRGGMRPSRTLRILGIYEPKGTRCVKLEIGRGKVTDVFSRSQEFPANARLALVDAQGETYEPIGYLYRKDQVTTIELRPGDYVATLDDLPRPPASGENELQLIFYVTEGETIVGFMFGGQPVARCNVSVDPKR
jgi:hypothetical protein